ncbi:MAG: hypothetical protein HY046_12900 [Acidobacteria bacterium]|nr:hypothetical protein [Acidobacteriota bacterium]
MSKKHVQLILIGVAIACHSNVALAQSSTPEYVSKSGVKYYALPDPKNTVEEADKKLAADPKNLDLIYARGQALGAVWRFKDAIAAYSRGLELAPNEVRFLVARGHRYVSTRQFDKARTDLEKAAKLDPKADGLWYHLALAHYFKGEFAAAAVAMQNARDAAKDDNALVGPSDWLYMSLRRAGKMAEAEKALERIHPEMKVGEHEQFYLNRLLLYKGLKSEEEIVPTEPVTDMESELKAATIGYGVGNWLLYNGHLIEARKYFHQITAGKSWAAFAFIGAEVELAKR